MAQNSDNEQMSKNQLQQPSDSDFTPPQRHERAFTPKGRPNKLTKEIIQQIYDSVRMGMPKDKAAPLAGISEATYHNWMRNGREVVNAIEEANQVQNAIHFECTELDQLYLELLEAVTLAESEFIKEGLDVILTEGPPGYRWALPRLFRKIFGDKLEVGVQTEPVQLELVLPGMITKDAENEPKQLEEPEQ